MSLDVGRASGDPPREATSAALAIPAGSDERARERLADALGALEAGERVAPGYTNIPL
ncbi:MAG TPA: hypothetical protein VGV36_04700 [Solirubrobacteraceae bacterium]|nr:hypothetical protein [Solirubrobacteraceae bacterium]